MLPGHLKMAENFIIKSFQSLGYTVIEQEYRPYGRRVKNIIAFIGENIPQESVTDNIINGLLASLVTAKDCGFK